MNRRTDLIIMELFLTVDFYRAFTRFITEISADCGEEQLFDIYKKIKEFKGAFEKDKCIDRIYDWISYIEKNDCIGFNQLHYEGYRNLKSGLPELSDTDLLNLYAVLFNTDNQHKISFPVREVLFEHLPEIVLRIAGESKAPVVFVNEDDVAEFERAMYEVLCDYELIFCDAGDYIITGEYSEPGSEEIEAPCEGHTWEEYLNVNCQVIITDGETVNRMRRAEYVACHYTTAVDGGIALVGNFLTFATAFFKDSVTLQITGRNRFDSYEEMYNRLGSEAFGYENKAPEVCAGETEEFFAGFFPEGPLALKVRALPCRLLSAKDFAVLKDLAKESV